MFVIGLLWDLFFIFFKQKSGNLQESGRQLQRLLGNPPSPTFCPIRTVSRIMTLKFKEHM